MNALFPIYVKLAQLQTLLVGGGPVALEKLTAIYANSPEAKVKLVALEINEEVRSFAADHPQISLHERLFEDSDLQGIDLIIMASNNDQLNRHVQQKAREQHILLNVADTPALCDFYLGSVVQKGNLKIGISTNGKSPTIAKRVKEYLNELLPEEIDETLELMAQLRQSLHGDFKEKLRILNAHTEDLLQLKKDD
ncbi:precorrin-2 dehydrogenase/sirohydrochlorin ferrochelatase family protein [Sphingobacterium sp. MYb382]|uniref:precorrin-2 dehydrogenase/sirohydrochlorin ferrochelatase family protein n=1 Tax=Sphingobacterium sp. MYb382 TaxID=2745278 RepID=UPI003096DAFB